MLSLSKHEFQDNMSSSTTDDPNHSTRTTFDPRPGSTVDPDCSK